MRQTGIGIRWAKVAASAWLCALALGLSGRVPEPGSKPISGVILHVDDDAPPDGDGLSWKSPLRFLQDALLIANTPGSGVSEIRIGQGTYKPDQGANQTPGDVNAPFTIPGGLALRGGYAGFGAPDPDAQDFKLYQSILSGDLLGNDGPPGSFQNYQDNSVLIVRVISEPAPVFVEGFSISAGTFEPFTTQVGAGMRCEGGSPQISHCRFQYNRSASYGGGLGIVGCEVATVNNCMFVENRAGLGGVGGGGLAARPLDFGECGAVNVTSSTFIENRADFGGAANALGMDIVTFTDCVFTQNFAFGDGGAIYAGSLSTNDYLIIERCQFIGNLADDYGGAVFARDSEFIDCDFVGNGATSLGGAIQVGLFFASEARIIGCRFIENTNFSAGSAAISGGFTGNSIILNCEFRANVPGVLGAGAGGTLTVIGGQVPIVNCLFTGNASPHQSAAVYVNFKAHADIINSTVVNNSAASGATGILSNGTAALINTIVWGNSGAQLEGNITASYSCIQDGWPGEGNISLDPQFIDALGPDGIPGTEDDDLRLSPGSPCIDAGDNTALPLDDHDIDGDGNILELIPIDFAQSLRRMNDPKTPNTGNPGIYHVVVDMGAFEFADFKPVFADITRDGWVGVEDLLAVISSWGACPGGLQDCPADLDRSGATDMQDLLLVLTNWM